MPEICGFDSPTDFNLPSSLYGFYWTDTTGTVTVEHPAGWGCPDHTCNQFSARISNRVSSFQAWTGADTCSPGPVVLFLPGAAMNNYWSEMELDPDDEAGIGDDPPEGLRLLYKKLYLEGARILEIRYRCQMLNDNISFYAGTESCQHTLLTPVLEELNQRDITEHAPGQAPVVTDEPWWPDQAACRFAMGASEGEAQLQFAVDVLTNTVGIMNRVVMGGGGTPFDLRGTIDCADTGVGDDLLAGCAWKGNDSCKNLEQVAFWFDSVDPLGNVVDECGGCWNGCEYDPHDDDNCAYPGNDPSKDCYDDPNNVYEEALDDGSIMTWIGDAEEDNARILGALLVNTGQDHGVNEDSNVQYESKHRAHNRTLWQWAHCQCDCSFWGHGTMNRTYALLEPFSLPNGRSPIDDWKEFFVDGDDAFDLDTSNPIDLSGYCTGPVDCEIVEPPDVVEHPTTCP